MRTAYLQNSQSARISLSNYARLQRSGLSVIIAFSIFLLGVFYLYQINNLVRESYTMRGLQKEYNGLKDQYKEIKADIAQAQSLSKLQDATKDMNMAPAGNVSYLGAGKGKVVIADRMSDIAP